MTSAPIILVPGFWLGAWAWDEVAEKLRADGHDVTALTLPGLELADADRSGVTLPGPCRRHRQRRRGGRARRSCSPCTAPPASPATPRATSSRTGLPPMVYVDTAPGKGAPDPEFEGVEKPFDLGGDQGGGEPRRAQRAAAGDVPASGRSRNQPDSCAMSTSSRTTPAGTSPRRSSRLGYTSEAYQTYAREHPDWAFLAGIAELRDVTWIDLPTSHWPMWSRPAETAAIIGDIATKAGGAR